MECSYSNPVNLGVDSWAFASSSCNLASSTPAIANGFTYGEILNGVFLFLTFTILAVGLFHLHFGRIKIKN